MNSSFQIKILSVKLIGNQTNDNSLRSKTQARFSVYEGRKKKDKNYDVCMISYLNNNTSQWNTANQMSKMSNYKLCQKTGRVISPNAKLNGCPVFK